MPTTLTYVASIPDSEDPHFVSDETTQRIGRNGPVTFVASRLCDFVFE